MIKGFILKHNCDVERLIEQSTQDGREKSFGNGGLTER
jgi:hypothetical protein